MTDRFVPPIDAASPLGTWGQPGLRSPHLVFTEDGDLTGCDGCNRLMGGWQRQGDDVVFGPLAATLLFCPGVDTWLIGAARAHVDGDLLRVFNASNTEIGVLKRYPGGPDDWPVKPVSF